MAALDRHGQDFSKEAWGHMGHRGCLKWGKEIKAFGSRLGSISGHDSGFKTCSHLGSHVDASTLATVVGEVCIGWATLSEVARERSPPHVMQIQQSATRFPKAIYTPLKTIHFNPPV